ncbi:MAG: pyridoxal phosphate-dependent aminotransferase [Planctomycetota bacterium]
MISHLAVSRRVDALKPSATLAVSAKAAELRAAGTEVLSFATGEPDFDTPEPIKNASWEALKAGKTKYGPVPGDPEGRSVIANKLTRENGIPNVTPDHVVVSSGGKHSLYNLFQALIDPPAPGEPPEELILPVPAWVSYAPQARLAGATVREVVTDASGDFKMTPDQLRAAINSNSRVLMLNSPSNPCGTMYTPDELRALGEVVRESVDIAPNLVVISDEIYEKIIFGGFEHFSIGSMPEISERVITVNGLSKAYAMTGWRIGYFAGSGGFGLAVAKGVRKLQSQSTTAIPTFLMPAIKSAFTECDADVERMRSAFAQRGQLISGLARDIPGVVAPTPTGAFYLFADVSAHFGKTTKNGTMLNAAMDFAGALLEEQHVAVVPGEDFGTGGEKCVRISFACSEEQIREGMQRFSSFVSDLS